MSATIPAPLAAALAQVPRATAFCLMLQAKDGLRQGFTTWSRPVTLDLGLGQGPETFDRGMNLSAITKAVGFVASNFEVHAPANGEFRPAKVYGGRWRRAAAWLVRVSPDVDGAAAGYQPVLRGRVAEGRIEGRRFVLEVRNAMDAYNQTQGEVMSPQCRTWFGDPVRCRVVREPFAAVVTAAESAHEFSVDLAGVHPDDFFNFGNAAFLTGEHGGTDERKIYDYDGATGTVELLEPLFEAPEVGDTLTLFRGCSKLLISDDPAVPTCVSYDNGVNFQGEPELPGDRQHRKVSALGTSYE
ncbi:DUF2163 domain-containing protein [Allopontixanthobacter sp.]|uniref:DUF2163 domain-containing protein n=1 Tax=Allopontixanthobacter sp. TaxID=2906452 RepID=UPI002AB9A3F7|nr:DUF2163 domain-containing protein [Allopontixanthobacter sp.]MDZ4306610.1 DUF2163 domain-containing protein [Allopontixanthobacter sp.]